jgi:DNA-binding IclR family transcriptional regulator
MLYLDQLTPDSELQVRDWTGHRIPMYAVPSGLVVLAADAALAQKVADGPLEALTPHTTTDGAQLLQRLQQVRDDGYAWAMEEFAAGLNSVAAAIRTAEGQVVAALHVYGPASRFPGDRSGAALGEMVKATADKIRIE